jgi:hypothetical protein
MFLEFSPEHFLPQERIFFLKPKNFLRMGPRHSGPQPLSPTSFSLSYPWFICLFSLFDFHSSTLHLFKQDCKLYGNAV